MRSLFVAFAFEGETALGFTQLYPLFSSVPARKAWVLTICSWSRERGVGVALLETRPFLPFNIGVTSDP